MTNNDYNDFIDEVFEMKANSSENEIRTMWLYKMGFIDTLMILGATDESIIRLSAIVEFTDTLTEMIVKRV
jgi:hypothetical protein